MVRFKVNDALFNIRYTLDPIKVIESPDETGRRENSKAVMTRNQK